jgi:hypothetical protein
VADHDGFCKCPILRLAAEMERLAGCGIIPQTALENGAGLASYAIRAIAIGSLRQRYGCRGPHGIEGSCPYQFVGVGDLVTDPNVPLLKRKDDRDVPGSYL